MVVDKAVTAQIAGDAVVKAPGMKYKHYAPACSVVIVDGNSEKAAACIRSRFTPGDRVLCFAEELPLYEGCNPLAYGSEAAPDTLSAGLFAALRELDKPGIGTVFARCPTGGGIAYAVQNRLKKAAGFQIIDAEAKENTVIGITGGTGCGKTTLFNILTGQMDYDGGEVYVNPHKRLGLISQIPKFPAGYTVEQVLRSAYTHLMGVKRRMEVLEQEMAAGATQEQLAAYDSLTNQFEAKIHRKQR